MTNQDAIDQAMRYAGILAAGDSATATDSADMLTELNQMLAAWAVDDKDLQFPPQDTLSDTFPVQAWAEGAVISNLGTRACAAFELPVSQELAMLASNGRNIVAKVLIGANMRPLDMSHMPKGAGNRGNILTGETT